MAVSAIRRMQDEEWLMIAAMKMNKEVCLVVRTEKNGIVRGLDWEWICIASGISVMPNIVRNCDEGSGNKCNRRLLKGAVISG